MLCFWEIMDHVALHSFVLLNWLLTSLNLFVWVYGLWLVSSFPYLCMKPVYFSYLLIYNVKTSHLCLYNRKATLIGQASNLNIDYERDGAFYICRIFYNKCGLVQEAGVLSASLAYLWKFSNNMESIFNSLGGKQ